MCTISPPLFQAGNISLCISWQRLSLWMMLKACNKGEFELFLLQCVPKWASIIFQLLYKKVIWTHLDQRHQVDGKPCCSNLFFLFMFISVFHSFFLSYWIRAESIFCVHFHAKHGARMHQKVKLKTEWHSV